jgi:hypothetical protein
MGILNILLSRGVKKDKKITVKVQGRELLFLCNLSVKCFWRNPATTYHTKPGCKKMAKKLIFARYLVIIPVQV